MKNLSVESEIFLNVKSSVLEKLLYLIITNLSL